MRNSFVTAPTVFVLIDALGWALGVLLVFRYALIHGDLPRIFGFRALSGPFEASEINALMIAGIIFGVISLLKLLAAHWIQGHRMDGPVLQLVLLGISAIFWYGFALPFGSPPGLIQVVLMALSWKAYS